MKNNYSLITSAPNKVLWRFCLPLFVSVIFQQFYNICDSLIAGRYIGEHALASIGNGYEITLFYLTFSFGISIACQVLVAKHFGEKDFNKLKSIISTSLIISIIIFAILVLGGLVFTEGILRLINTPKELFADSEKYIIIYTLSIPFMFVYNLSNGVFSGLGDSKRPFIFLVISSLSNVVLDYIFVKYFSLGVAGTAYATLICQAVCAVVSFGVIIKRVILIAGKEKFVLFDKTQIKDFFVIMLPSTIQQGTIAVGTIFLQGFINSFGAGVVAGYSAGAKLNNLYITGITSLSNGMSSYTSQNLGAQKPDRIGEGYKAGAKLITYICIIFASIYFIFPKQILSMFIKNPSKISIASGSSFLRIVSPFYIFVSLKLLADGVLRGASKMKWYMISTLADLFLRVLISFMLYKTRLGYLGIWISWPFGWMATSVISIMFYIKEKRRQFS